MGSLLLVAVLVLGGAAADPQAAAGRDQAREIAGRLVCFCGTCSNQSIRDCTCGTAAAAREDIRDRLARGESEQEILDDYVRRYGEQILIAPGRAGFNLVAWVTPFIALVLGGTALIWFLRRFSASRPAAAAGAGGGGPAGTDRLLRERIEREMREYDA